MSGLFFDKEPWVPLVMAGDDIAVEALDQAKKPGDLSSQKAQQIMEAAGALFFDQGFGATSMGQIASHAGVSKGTLYNYFSDKDDLFAAVIRCACELHNAGLFSLQTGERDVARVLHHVASEFVQFVTSEHPTAAYRVVIAEAPRFPHLGRIFYETGPKAGMQRLAEYLAWAVAEGLIEIDDTQNASREFLELSKVAVHMQRMLNLRGPVERDEAETLATNAVEKFLNIYPLRSTV